VGLGTLTTPCLVLFFSFSLVFCPVLPAHSAIESLKATPQPTFSIIRFAEILKEQDPQLAEAKLLAEKGMVSEAERPSPVLDKNKGFCFRSFLARVHLIPGNPGERRRQIRNASCSLLGEVADGSDKGTREAKAKASLANTPKARNTMIQRPRFEKSSHSIMFC